MTCHDAAPEAPRETGARRFALVGNPNAGKSTVFNALTGMRAKVANYPGVTVSRFVGSVEVRDVSGARIDAQVEDLPGTYSLDPISPDEQVVLESLSDDNRADALIAVLDATSMRRSLGLIAQLQRTGLPILVALTHADEFLSRGGSVDVAALSKALGHRVLVVTAGNHRELDALKAQLASEEDWPSPAVPAPTIPKGSAAWIESVLEAAHYRAPGTHARTRKLDAVLLHPVWGSLVFFAAMFALFQLIFTVAAPIQGWIEEGFALLGDVARENIGVDWLAGLVADGLIGGVGGVLTFVPQIFLLFFALAILEASGYMSRAAFLMDRVMAGAGLEGRAFVAMLSSLACAIPGIMATRSLPSAKDRLATMLTIPLMTCSARLPVYTMLIAMLIPADARLGGVIGAQGAALFGLYVLGACSAMGSAWVFSKIFGRGRANLPFYMEMPTYRIPTLRELVTNTWIPVKGFLTKVGRIILLLTLVLWALLNLPAVGDAELAAAGIDQSDSAAVATYQLEHSYGAGLGKTVQPVFEPLGFDWRVSVGVVASLGAREVFVSTLGQIASASDPENPGDALSSLTWGPGPHEGQLLFTPGTIAALLVFFVFALQCTSTIAALRRESGSWTWPALAFFYMFALAWVGAFIAKLAVGALA
ncbi:ferrous iron transporter B [Dermabacter vaginalis]|uniref:Ferrous iron transporter B n=1 Tax=Dermabacter vaginalis TaxID=1630135 RepID=A0ABX6A1M3_9MICO|nr:ferrous iron transporter B [Dermabacter vaginalis]QEU11059.1 ferrous iron transporter B [Dermabacter vaginalis]